MKSERHFIDYFQDIAESIQKIESFIDGFSKDEFERDEKTQYAIVRALEIIGKASKNIPSHIRNQYTELPWRAMIGISDKLALDFIGVDVKVVWKTITIDIPTIKPMVEKIVKTLK